MGGDKRKKRPFEEPNEKIPLKLKIKSQVSSSPNLLLFFSSQYIYHVLFIVNCL